MKKRTVILLSLALSLSLFGCGGNSAEPKQDETQTQEQEAEQEQEQEKTEADAETEQEENKEQTYIEHEFLYVTEKALRGEKEIDMDSLEPNGGNYTLTNSVDIYGNKGGVIGYTKPNINVNVVTSNEDWYCLYFEQEEPTYQYVLVKAEDFLSNSAQVGTDLADSEDTVEEESTTSEEISEYDKPIQDALDLIDENKTYTIEEFHELMGGMAEILGVRYTTDICDDAVVHQIKMNLHGKEMKQILEDEGYLYVIYEGYTEGEKFDFYININSEDEGKEGEIDVAIFRKRR